MSQLGVVGPFFRLFSKRSRRPGLSRIVQRLGIAVEFRPQSSESTPWSQPAIYLQATWFADVSRHLIGQATIELADAILLSPNVCCIDLSSV